MSETPARYVTESDKEKARMIAKICWYTGRSALQTLAWILEIDEDEVEDIIGSDEHLAANEVIRDGRVGAHREDLAQFIMQKGWIPCPPLFL